MSKRLIYVEDAIEALEALFVKQIKQFDYESYEKADEKTQLMCDGISESIGRLLNMPSAQPQDIARDIANIYVLFPTVSTEYHMLAVSIMFAGALAGGD